MTENTRLEKILLHDRWIVCAGLVAMSLLAWAYLLSGAGMAMSPLDMMSFSFQPHKDAGRMLAMPEMNMMPGQWLLQQWIIVLMMWWVMMIAMMVPSAAPMVLLYTRVVRHNYHSESTNKISQVILFFVCGYLVAWLVFSVIATLIHWALEKNTWLSMEMVSNEGGLTAGLLILVGVYQLTPLKQACLKKCRSPAQFISDHMKYGNFGAMQMGIEHGIFCVGCCWALMLLLFAGGVMNLAWIFFLTLFVLAEKIFPFGEKISSLTGYVLLVWGFVLVITLLI